MCMYSVLTVFGWKELLFSHNFVHCLFHALKTENMISVSFAIVPRNQRAHKIEINLFAMCCLVGWLVGIVFFFLLFFVCCDLAALQMYARVRYTRPQYWVHFLFYVYNVHITWTMCQFTFVFCLSFSNKMFYLGRLNFYFVSRFFLHFFSSPDFFFFSFFICFILILILFSKCVAGVVIFILCA